MDYFFLFYLGIYRKALGLGAGLGAGQLSPWGPEAWALIGRRALWNQDGSGGGSQQDKALGQQDILKAPWEAVPHNIGPKGREWASAFAVLRNLF